MPEYYIKMNGSKEAQGPFNEEELRTFFAAGKIGPKTPHFYDDLIGWQPIETHERLFAALLDDGKPKLTLKKREKTREEAITSETGKPGVKVDAMLKSATLGNKATRAITGEKRWEDRVGALSMPLLALLDLAMGALLVFANWKTLMGILTQGTNFQEFLLFPALLLGVVTFTLGVLLLLSLTAVFPAVRYTAFALMGYLGVLSWSYFYEGLPNGWLLLGSGLGFGVGVYTTTLTLDFRVFCLAILLAAGGVCGYAYFLLGV